MFYKFVKINKMTKEIINTNYAFLNGKIIYK